MMDTQLLEVAVTHPPETIYRITEPEPDAGEHFKKYLLVTKVILILIKLCILLLILLYYDYHQHILHSTSSDGTNLHHDHLNIRHTTDPNYHD